MVSVFLIKTYQLVDDASIDHIVSWGEDHTTFVVWSPSEMARVVLPFFFKHSNFFSFVMQLNLYGFRKVAPDRWEFANEFFRKGSKHLLCKIQRWKIGKAAWSGPPSKNCADDQHCGGCNDVTSVTAPSSSPMMSPVQVLGRETFSSENERLVREGHAKLLSELTRIRCLYEESLSIIPRQQSPMKESSGPQKCVSGSRDSQCYHLQQRHIGEFPFKDLDDPARKEGLCISMGSSWLENKDINGLPMSPTQELQRENRENRDGDNNAPPMKSVRSPCVCNDVTSLIPASQPPMMVPACIEVGREPLSLLKNENNSLRRDNAILLSELTHVRKLYNEALSIIEIQQNQLEEANHLQQHPLGVKIINGQSGDTDGHPVSPAAAPLNGSDVLQHKRNSIASPSFKHDAKKPRRCQDACELVPQAATLDNVGEKNSYLQSVNEEIKAQIRLFGVPLRSSKER